MVAPIADGHSVDASFVTLLTGGSDRPYAIGMAGALTTAGLCVDFIGSDELIALELTSNARLRFLNLRGDQRPEATPLQKLFRVLVYYWRLLGYARNAEPRVFHILWNNRFQFVDCVCLMLYYKWLGKQIVFTAHNVNAGRRDGHDSWWNRFLVKIQYHLSDHIFLHTEKMKQELLTDFGIAEAKTSIIPLGINDTSLQTSLSSLEARRHLGINPEDQVVLFFGRIKPYKGLEYLLGAFTVAAKRNSRLRLIVAGQPMGCDEYWESIQRSLEACGVRARILERIEFIPDDETELFFKASDVLVLPYVNIFQSGLLALSYNFGLPVIATDVGSLRDEVVEGETGFICRPQDPDDLAMALEKYFSSDLFHELEHRRSVIRTLANERYSWNKVAAITTKIYAQLLQA